MLLVSERMLDFILLLRVLDRFADFLERNFVIQAKRPNRYSLYQIQEADCLEIWRVDFGLA